VLRWFTAVSAALCVLLVGGAAIAGGTVLAQPGGGWVKPLARASISQPFGCTSAVFEPVDAACPGGHWHSGVDLAAARGTPVRAPLAGVARVMHSTYGYGLHVLLDHGSGLVTLYAHMMSTAVITGAAVGAGEVIGSVGSTGNSTGPHLHFEVRRDGVPEDPRLDVALP